MSCPSSTSGPRPLIVSRGTMCRLLCYVGEPQLLADIVLWPKRSIIRQSYDARERKQDSTLPYHLAYGNLNGDGFGIGWYPSESEGFNTDELDDPSPCVYNDITPAWNNQNVARLTKKIKSPLIFAHVRAAYPGIPTTQDNTHPFTFSRYLFMHNGTIGGWKQIRRALISGLCEEAYNAVQSFQSDSAVSFAIFLHHLPDRRAQLPAGVLLKALENTIQTIRTAQSEAGIDETSLLNFVLSDGKTVVATRYVWPDNESPATLYYAEGTSFERLLEPHEQMLTGKGMVRYGGPSSAAACGCLPSSNLHGKLPGTGGGAVKGDGEYCLTYGEKGSRTVLVASEPITEDKTDWILLPKNTALVITIEKGGYVNALRSPLCPTVVAPSTALAAAPSPLLSSISPAPPPINPHILGLHPSPSGCSLGEGGWVGGPISCPLALLQQRHEDVLQCLESVVAGRELVGRRWSPTRPALARPPHASLLGNGPASHQATEDSGEGTEDITRDGRSPLLPGGEGHVQVKEGEESRLVGHQAPVRCLLIEGGQLYCGSADGRISVWDLTDFRLANILIGHTRPVVALAWYAGRLLSVAGRTLRVWDPVSARCLIAVAIKDAQSKANITSISLDPHAGVLYIGKQDTSIQGLRLDPLLDLCRANAALPTDPNPAETSSRPPTAPLPQPPPALEAIDETAETDETTAPLAVPTVNRRLSSGAPTPAAAGPMSIPRPPSRLAIASTAAAPKLAPLSKQKDCDEPEVYEPDFTFPGAFGHCGEITAAVISGAFLVTGGVDCTLRVWCRDSLSLVHVLRGHRGSVLALAAIGSLVLSGGRDHSVRVWDMESMVCRHVLSGHKDDILHIHVPSLGCDGTKIDPAATSAPTFGSPRPSDGPGPLPCPLLARVSSWIKSGSANPLISSLLANGTPTAHGAGNGFESPLMTSPKAEMYGGRTTPFPLHALGAATPAALVATCSADGTVRVWCSATWTCVGVFTCVEAPPAAAAARAPGFYLPWKFLCAAVFSGCLITGSMDGVCRIYSLDTVLAATKALIRKQAEMEGAWTSVPAALDLTATANGGAEGAGGGPSPKRRKIAEGAKLFEDPSAAAAASPHPSATADALRAQAERSLLRSLHEFVRIRSVSCDPNLRDECFRGAKFVARLIEKLGAEVVLSRADDATNPVVFGRLGQDPALPTVTFYAHYDVQPAFDFEWDTPPFEVVSTNGFLYGRGTSDNKGPLLGFVYAVKELKDGSGGRLPCNVRFVFEGEEENGSHGFAAALQQHRHWLEGTDVIVISNTSWIGENLPCLTVGMRGMITVSLEVSGPVRDVHSGNDGGVFDEPLADLVKVLGSLVDSHNNVMVPGFYDDIAPGDPNNDPQMKVVVESGEFSLDEYRQQLGVPRLTGHRRYTPAEVLHQRWQRPNLSVVDVRVNETEVRGTSHAGAKHPAAHLDGNHGSGEGHYRYGPTRFSVIPRKAIGQVSIRYVPNQRAEILTESLRRHCEHEFFKLRSPNSLRLHIHSRGDWWQMPSDRPQLMHCATRALAAVWGTPPLLVREGGTMPVTRLLEGTLRAPALLLPFGQSTDNTHLPNERLRLVNLLRGKEAVKTLLGELGKAGKRALQAAVAEDDHRGEA